MSDTQIVVLYATRRYTIRQLAALSGRSYEKVRKLLVNAGYKNGRLI